jgi:hypothetical protein
VVLAAGAEKFTNFRCAEVRTENCGAGLEQDAAGEWSDQYGVESEAVDHLGDESCRVIVIR